ncbi:MAG TPA: hypothetical protein VI030_14555 [Propionibacteriaceae bacterium]
MLGGDPLAVGGCGTDNISHIVGAPRHCNAGRLLVDQDVESAALKVPVGILRGQPLSAHAVLRQPSG